MNLFFNNEAMQPKKIFILSVLILIALRVSGQVDSASLIKYTPDYDFKNGIFFSFDQVKKNNPLPKTRIITSVGYDNPHFFDNVLNKNKITYYDNLGNQKEVTIKNIWGYAKNGVLYIKINSGYSRITMIGSISHFVANYTNYNSSSTYPYYYDGYYHDPYRMPPSSYSNTEIRQYLLDFNTGQIYEYTPKNLEILLMNDPEIYEEFNALSRKKKKQQKFMFLRKFNEKNPLYVPKN